VKNSKTRLLLAVIFGVAGGLLSSLAYPANAIWIAIIPSIALILYAISLVKPAQSLLVGFFAGVAFYASQIPWMTVYLGPVPWLALSVLEGLIFALGSLAIALALKAAKTWPSTYFSNANLALIVASLWTCLLYTSDAADE
jgi:apolipoprotein N-acyltransferase